MKRKRKPKRPDLAKIAAAAYRKALRECLAAHGERRTA